MNKYKLKLELKYERTLDFKEILESNIFEFPNPIKEKDYIFLALPQMNGPGEQQLRLQVSSIDHMITEGYTLLEARKSVQFSAGCSTTKKEFEDWVNICRNYINQLKP